MPHRSKYLTAVHVFMLNLMYSVENQRPVREQKIFGKCVLGARPCVMHDYTDTSIRDLSRTVHAISEPACRITFHSMVDLGIFLEGVRARVFKNNIKYKFMKKKIQTCFVFKHIINYYESEMYKLINI